MRRRLAAKRQRERAALERRERVEAQARAASVPVPPVFEVADVRTWRPSGVDCIVTDPPYVAVELYAALADFAVEVLPEGAPLVVMTDTVRLPGVLRAMERPGLVYRTTIAWKYADGHKRDFPRLLFPAWKPVLVFHRQHWQGARWLWTEVASKTPGKGLHEYEQEVGGFERLVRAFSSPGDLVCDPFLGSGTTAVAALSNGRRFIGADIEVRHVETARSRLAAS